MAIEPKTIREKLISLYGHVKGVKRDIIHMHKDIEKLGGKIDKIYWVLLAAVGAVAYLVIDKLI
jgi:predicted hydrolase (HD superfamily)